MKRLLFTIGVLYCFHPAFSQQEQTGKWMLHVNAGAEAHDKRYLNASFAHFLLPQQPEIWGTGHLALGVRRKVAQHRGVSGYLGLGMAFEQANFKRPFNHGLFVNDGHRILLFQNRYRKFQTNLTAMVISELGAGWFISGELVSHYLLFRDISHTESNHSGFPYSESTFELEDLQFRLGINYRIGNWFVGLNSRVVNFQQVDKIIFYGPKVDQKWEWHNPLRFDLTVGYLFF